MKLCACILLLAAAAFGADLTGKWSGTFDATGPDGSTRNSSAYMDLKQSGEKVTGTAGPDSARQKEISNGKLAGTKLTFEVVQPDGGPVMKFNLTFDGVTIKGKATGERDGQKMEAKLDLRKEPLPK